MRLRAWCDGQVVTARNGRPIRPTLEPGDLMQIVGEIVAPSG